MDYTKAQVGAANTPDLHLSTEMSETQAAVDFTGDEFDSLPVTAAPSSIRSWRSRDQGAPAPEIALGTDQTRRAALHQLPGEPDGRRTDTELGGNPSAPELESLSPSPVRYHNDRDAVAINPVPAPTRPKQGFTGADPTRAAQSQRAYVLRPFDKWAADHPGAVEKIPQTAPHAAQPPKRGRLVGGLPSPMGSAETTSDAVGPGRNSFRLLPRAWDELLIDTGGPAATGNNDPARAAVASRRGAGWRL